jgi:glycosyltransferase involved in cell wall biosynthesis
VHIQTPRGSFPSTVSGRAQSFGILSSFPPTACGIATFSAALAAGLVANGACVDVVRCGVAPPMEDPLVLASLPDRPGPHAAALEVLNSTDVAIVQHEYGLYDGPDGEAVVAVLGDLRVPSVLVAHTVLEHPTTNQRHVLEEVCRLADVVVVMTETARTRLATHWDVEMSKVTVIAHGAATPPASSPTPEGATNGGRPPRLLTWGLLGPGKGIEWAIDAISLLSDLRPRPTYLIAGATHPKVRAHSGESYREMLVSRAWRSGTAPSVSFDDTYRDLAGLTELIRSADLVVLPYDSVDQVTSGVLVDAVAAGRPVVSTAFPHAVELLGTGAGIVVPQRDPIALAEAVRAVLTDPDLAASMATEARRLAPALSWNRVAAQYAALSDQILAGSSGSRS